MAMTGAALGTAIKSAMDALVDPDSDDIYAALGSAIIDYIEANAVITVTVPDVTAGGDEASGTATIT